MAELCAVGAGRERRDRKSSDLLWILYEIAKKTDSALLKTTSRIFGQEARSVLMVEAHGTSNTNDCSPCRGIEIACHYKH